MVSAASAGKLTIMKNTAPEAFVPIIPELTPLAFADCATSKNRSTSTSKDKKSAK